MPCVIFSMTAEMSVATPDMTPAHAGQAFPTMPQIATSDVPMIVGRLFFSIVWFFLFDWWLGVRSTKLSRPEDPAPVDQRPPLGDSDQAGDDPDFDFVQPEREITRVDEQDAPLIRPLGEHDGRLRAVVHAVRARAVARPLVHVDPHPRVREHVLERPRVVDG